MSLDGFSVATALSSEDALDYLDEHPVKLVIADQKMPGSMSGTDLLAQIRIRHPHVRSMILSAYSEPRYVIDAVNKAGACQYLLKPWNRAELVLRVREALRVYDLEAEQRRLCAANERLLKRISLMENFSVIGEFSRALYEQFGPLSAKLLKQAGEQLVKFESCISSSSQMELAAIREWRSWQALWAVISRLGDLSALYETWQFSGGLSGRPAGQFESCDIPALVRPLVERAQQGDLSRVSFSFCATSGLPPVAVHRDALSLAIKALIENAVVFNAKMESRVGVRVEKKDIEGETFVVIGVEDNGDGIPEGERSKIFSPLYSSRGLQVPSSGWAFPSKGEYNFSDYYHVGLGLPVARWCVARHDGFLDFTTTPGEGSLFSVYLPVLKKG